jgi:hypothetical protein
MMVRSSIGSLVFGAMVLLTACGSNVQPAPASLTATPSAEAVATTRTTPRPLCPTAIVGEPDPATVIDARANIYGAGRAEPVEPGGFGAGRLPPVWPLPRGGKRVVTISDVAGCVTPISGSTPFHGPAGDGVGPTLVEPHEGISGITHRRNGMFLVGVFVTDAEPRDPAPPTLDFTDGEDFASIEPEIGQVFFIGDGQNRQFVAPAEATRLFLGFADAPSYRGPPGAYDNNAGRLAATVSVAAN